MRALHPHQESREMMSNVPRNIEEETEAIEGEIDRAYELRKHRIIGRSNFIQCACGHLNASEAGRREHLRDVAKGRAIQRSYEGLLKWARP